MRIYTEVNFQWDDKKGKLVEVSSKSFDYSGEMALCLEWKDWKTRWYDDAGRVYKIRVKMGSGKYPVKAADIKVSEDGGATWKMERKAIIKKNHGVDYTHREFREYVERQSTKSSTAHGTKGADDAGAAWKGWFRSEDGYNRDPYTESGSNIKFVTAVESGVLTWDAGKGDYVTAEGLLFEEEPGDPDDKPVSKVLAEDALRGLMAEWTKIIDKDEIDPFQDELELAIDQLELKEQDVIDAYEALIEEGGEFDVIREEWETKKELLTGKPFMYEGKAYTADAALKLGIITEEEYGEYAGTYGVGIREEKKIREEGLEGTILSREEELEALREGAAGEVRSAEAKIGAAGFASTGVGRTAREMLAEEIGKEARDIEEGVTEERANIREGYTTAVGPLVTGKRTALKEYETTRDISAKDAQAGWKAATTAWEEKLKEYGALKGEGIAPEYTLMGAPLFRPSIGAESALKGIGLEMESIIRDVRTGAGLYADLGAIPSYDPFLEGGALAQLDPFTEMGADLGMMFEEESVAGLFQPTVEALKYTPTTAFQAYDPEYILPWEVGGGQGEAGVTGKLGGLR